MKQGWQIKDFELCLDKTKTTTKLKSSLYGEQGAFPIVSQEKELISGYWDKEEDVFKHKTPIVVFGDHTKVVKYIDFDFVIGADGVKILSPKPFLNPKYFYYWVCSVQIPSHGYARHYRYLKEHQVPVPNLSEQQRIVALLDAEFAKIDALKANAEKNLQNAKDLFQTALKKELEPKEGWKKDFLSKIAYISRGRSQHRPRNEASLYGGDYPFIQTGDIRDANGGTISTFNQTYSEIGLQQSKLWKKGTICITIAANIGETAILGMDACFPDSVVGIIPDNQIVCTDFLNYCLTKEKDELNEIAHGTAQKNINVAILEKVLITYPIEISIQQSIVARLDALNEKCKTLQANYEKTIALCDDLKQALLRKAFDGEI